MGRPESDGEGVDTGGFDEGNDIGGVRVEIAWRTIISPVFAGREFAMLPIKPN